MDAVLLFATVFVSPHVFVYDLVILAPAVGLLADVTRLQLSVLIFVALFYLTVTIDEESARSSS